MSRKIITIITSIVTILIIIIVALILVFFNSKQTVREDWIKATLEPVDCPPVKEIKYPAAYYQGPLIDTHFHFGSLPTWPPGEEESPDYGWLGWKIKIDDIACTLKHDGTVAAFAFFNVWPDIASPSLKVTKLIMERYPTLFVPFIQAPNDPYPMVRAPVLKEMLEVNPGLFKGIGEIGFYGVDGEIADPPPDAPLYLANYKLAQKHNLMVYYHLGRGHQENFKRVLQQHPDINFIFHGDTVSDEDKVVGIVTDIIRNHPNAFYTVDELYGDVWLLRPGLRKEKFLAHFKDYEPLLKQDLGTWKKVIEAYPDQFMWGTDRGDEPIWTYDRYVGQQLTDYARAFIGRLDPAVQEKFAHKNAARLLQKNN